MKKLLCTLLAIVMILSCTVIAFAADSSDALQFNKDGKFKIMQINDTQDTNSMQKKTVAFLKAALESEKPDLVVIAGDMLSDMFPLPTKQRLSDALRALGGIFEDAGVPFTVTFGNHDHDHEKTLPLNEMIAVLSEFSTFRHSEGYNEGTFNLPILSSDGSHYAFNIYMMDTNNKLDGDYAGVFPEQVEWYKQKSDELKAENGGKVVPSLVFQHIPVKEVHQFFVEGEKGADDSFFNFDDSKWYTPDWSLVDPEDCFVGEIPCSEPVTRTTGQYEAWLEKGDVIGAFFGHDHVINFWGTTKDGIDLGYNAGTGFNAYGFGDRRSVRIFELDENDIENYTTRTVFYGELTGDRFDFYITDILSTAAFVEIFRLFYKLFPFFK
ncbi:MAG: metallophosphoesterase [Acutalibacteraceae bacterium]|nr:metallophosphoesterase [Acutalibacteraceae bacterium]